MAKWASPPRIPSYRPSRPVIKIHNDILFLTRHLGDKLRRMTKKKKAKPYSYIKPIILPSKPGRRPKKRTVKHVQPPVVLTPGKSESSAQRRQPLTATFWVPCSTTKFGAKRTACPMKKKKKLPGHYPTSDLHLLSTLRHLRPYIIQPKAAILGLSIDLQSKSQLSSFINTKWRQI